LQKVQFSIYFNGLLFFITVLAMLVKVNYTVNHKKWQYVCNRNSGNS